MEITQLIEDNMLDYAGAVNQARAIPDARTGLKPIHRKILYEMYADKIKSDGKFKKCAYMVGQIIARFSEHGDAATYDALVRLGQPWIQRYPLINFHGNNGSQFGDGPAAMRYTEAKLSSLSEQGFLQTLGKDTVDWIPNFTNEEEEPSTLPAVFPGLFCLPNQGMGYGAACHFVTYNLHEVAQMIIKYIRENELDVIYPDLASGGELVNPKIINSIYSTGKGSIIIDSVYKIQGQQIEFTEIPFNVDFDTILDEISEIWNKDEITGIANVRNNSGAGKLSLIIDVEKGHEPEKIVELLFGQTKLRNSYPVNQVALVDNQPKLLTMKEMVEVYIEHNRKCIQREYEFEYDKTMKRLHILEGLIWAVQNIDDVIKAIRAGQNLSEIMPTFSDKQIKAILDMKLGRLSKLEEGKLIQEKKEKEEYAAACKQIIESSNEQKKILIERLQALDRTFGDKRRTKINEKVIIKNAAGGARKSKVVVPEDVFVSMTNTGYIKSVPVKAYRNSVSDTTVFKAQTTDIILLFSSFGKVYRLKVDNIKQCGSKDKGQACGALLNLEQGEKILNIFSMNTDERYPYIVGFTKNGLVKKSEKMIYVGATQNKNGLKAATLLEGDEYLGWFECNGDYAIVVTNNGNGIMFDMCKVNAIGKNGRGVKAISLAASDCVVGAAIIAPTVDKVKINSYNIEVKKMKLQGRGGKGAQIV